MNEDERATFLRRLAAFLIDAGVVLFLGTGFLSAWIIAELGGVPQTADDYAAMFEVAPLVGPDFLNLALILYAVLSFTPILGRRTVGMRQVGIRVVRDIGRV
jgi:uncharacterized RDD family membrane protein YckC